MKRWPAAALVFFAILAAAPGTAQDAEKSITIHAKKYDFEPAEITLKRGETVKLILISDDVAHGLEVKGLKLKADMPKDHPTEVSVTPTELGDFKGTCSKMCGIGHNRMKLVVHVVEP